MKQYKYLHHPTQNYIELISEKDSSLSVTYKKEFNFLRLFEPTKKEKSSDMPWRFTYVNRDEKAYLFQRTTGDDTFCQGFVGNVDEINGLPAEYINTFEKTYSEADLKGISDKNLPRKGEFDLSLAKELKPIFAKLVNAIMNGKKPIVIMGEDINLLTKYVKVLSQLFPTHFAKKITFSVGGNNIPSRVVDLASIGEKYIDVYAITSNMYNEYSSIFHCFVVSEQMGIKDNYSDELNYYSKIIEELQEDLIVGNTMKIKRLIKQICGAFKPNGTVNESELKCVITLNDFETQQTYENSKKLLVCKDENKDFYFDINSIIQAIEVIINEPSMTKKDLELIDKMRNEDQTLHDASMDIYLDFILRKLNDDSKFELSSYQKEDIIRKLSEIKEEEFKNNNFVRRICSKQNGLAFILLCEAFLNSSKLHILKYAVTYAAVTYNLPQSNQLKAFNNFTVVAENDFDKETLLTCVYLAGCIAVRGVNKEQRIKAFKDFYESKKLKPLELIDYILVINSEVARICKMIQDNFDDDSFSLLPVEWLSDIVTKLTLENCLDLINADTRHNVTDYQDLHSIIRDRCINFEKVSQALRNENILINKYKTFMERANLSTDEKEPFEALINDIEAQANVDLDLQKFRTQFVLDIYKTLNIKKRKELRIDFYSQNPEIKSFDWFSTKEDYFEDIFNLDMNVPKNRRLVQKLVNYLTGKFKNNKYDLNFYQGGNKSYFVFASIQGILLFLVSVIIMLLPPIIKSALIGTSIYKEYLSYFRFYYLGICLYTYILYMISYIKAFVSVKVKDLNDCKKIAFKNTMLFAIIPMIVFVLFYFMFYVFINQLF